MTTEDQVKLELETERLEYQITTLHEASAGVTAVNADAITAEAERQTVMDILIDAGVCSKTSYMSSFADNLQEAIAGLAEAGMIDISATVDADDGVAGEA